MRIHELGLQLETVTRQPPTQSTLMAYLRAPDGVSKKEVLWYSDSDQSWLEQARMAYVVTAMMNYLNSGGSPVELQTAWLQLHRLIGDSLAGELQLVDWQTHDATRYAVQLEPTVVYAVHPQQQTVAYAAADYDASLLFSDDGS